LVIQEKEMKETRVVIENLQSQFALQMQLLNQQAMILDEHHHFIEQVLKPQHDQMQPLTQTMMTLSQPQIAKEPNVIHRKTMEDMALPM
jgi:hypothetical protein